MKPLKIAICGLGTVGAGTFHLLRKNRDLVNRRAGCNLEISCVGARRDNPDCDLEGIRVERDVMAVVDSDVNVVVELMGGTTTARELVLAAMAKGKHVVTANKALIAEHGDELMAVARFNNVHLAFEAAVAGGIPIISALRDGLAANNIEWLAGIINGTGNFILTEMRDKGRAFADVLAEAQSLGYAEADPAFDIEGIDAAHKLAILASLVFNTPLSIEAIYIEGITGLQTVDITHAEQFGYRIKHLAVARRRGTGVELRVHPTLIPESALIAEVDGVMNAIAVQGDAVGPTLFYGAGAGAGPTASAVVADIIAIARDNSVGSGSASATLVDDALQAAQAVLPPEDMETARYLRISALDRPGVLSAVAQIMSNHGISIEAIIQKEPHPGENHVPLIMLTNSTRERTLLSALREIEALSSVEGPVVHIRVEHLDG